jgi:polyphosphate kinase
LAIKQTLYRTSRDSPIMGSLIHAANEGKQVVVLVELQARFDEERNIEWAQRLEDVGVHVVYGVAGLKTHTKISLVVRDEGEAITRYAHIGTGNYNETTARIYEDVGLFTTDPAIGADLSDLFNFLTGYSRQRNYRRMAVAPDGLRSRLLELIEAETAAGRDGVITMKMNSLVDPGMIEALYAASEAGVRIDLIVRGICCLVPGVPGMSSNIGVRSIVGRYLEHSRIYRFGSRHRERTYLIGSADLMPRNLDHRVEALVPVDDPSLQFRIDEILEVLLADDELAWSLNPDGQWERVPDELGINSHATLQGLAHARSRALV